MAAGFSDVTVSGAAVVNVIVLSVDVDAALLLPTASWATPPASEAMTVPLVVTGTVTV